MENRRYEKVAFNLEEIVEIIRLQEEIADRKRSVNEYTIAPVYQNWRLFTLHIKKG